MLVQEFDYELPEELIAQTPLEKRDRSRLMVVDRTKGSISHRCFTDIVDYVSPGDLLVVNNTKVIPARLYGHRKTGGKVEVLLLKYLGNDNWECLVKPGNKIKPGDKLSVGEGKDLMWGTVVSRTEFGGRVVHWEYQGNFQDNLMRYGHVPLPPYIKEPLSDSNRYQTVYAQVPGSAAAPTAGLHFTDALMQEVVEQGASFAGVTLNVGLGTFRPVREEVVEEHKMHEEFYSISEEAAQSIGACKARQGKIFAVGTTVVRTLESAAEEDGTVDAKHGDTNLFITPGYRFKVIDRLITNFHLPKSTLLMLVMAFAGRDLIRFAYQEAIKERYRFFSFGDAMLII